MNKKIKATVMVILVGVILFSASMVFPVLYNSPYRDLMQGAAVGFLMAGAFIALKTLLMHRNGAK